MDFVNGFLRSSRGNESIWVIVCHLLKVAYFLPVPAKRNSRMLANLYVNEIVKLYGVSITIVSDRDPSITLAFWKSLNERLDTKLAHSSAYHPQTDGQTERVNQIMEDILRAYV